MSPLHVLSIICVMRAMRLPKPIVQMEQLFIAHNAVDVSVTTPVNSANINVRC